MLQEQAASVELRKACAELERRLAAGESYSAEAAFASNPGLGEDSNAAIEIVYTEFVARERLGQRPSSAEYFARFPQWRDSLEQLFQIHRAAGGVSIASPNATPSPDHVPPLAAADSVRRVGSYEILSELGRGGMGVVYKARQTGLNRLVAIKMILAGADAGPKERARFRTEAEAAARLQHPNIVQIYEVGEHEGRPFLSMELVEGGSLEQRLNGTPSPAADAARLVETLAHAMQHAHEQGIVHRDLKPANVLSGAEHPKVTDFGLARRLGPDALTALTAAGAVVGTPAYMAPEQAAGEGREVGPAADIYALGAILYEMLTGRPPFRGIGMLETLDQVRTQEPVPPSRLMPGLPRDIETICLKCLNKEPARRYESAAALADDLGRFLRGEPIRARPVGAWERGWKWACRRPAVAGSLTAIGLLLLTGLPLMTVLWRQAVAARADEQKHRERAEQNLGARSIALARAAWMLNDLPLARHALEDCPAALRDAEWHYLNRACYAERERLAGHTFELAALAFSPDGQRLLSAG